MLLVPMNFVSEFCFCFMCCQSKCDFGACFKLRSRDTHIDFLQLLFPVGMICPLMQEKLFIVAK